MTTYVEVLKASGLKATVQRLSIMEVINHQGHISIDALYQSLHHTYPTLSLATIYKNILMMIEKNIVVEEPISGAKSQYELKKKEHVHLVCQVCGLVEDEELNLSLSYLNKNNSFSLSHSQINLYGICSACQVAS